MTNMGFNTANIDKGALTPGMFDRTDDLLSQLESKVADYLKEEGLDIGSGAGRPVAEALNPDKVNDYVAEVSRIAGATNYPTSVAGAHVSEMVY